MGVIVGIDLGTTYTVVSYIDPLTKKPQIIKNKYNNNTTPSVIGMLPEGGYAIGEDAKVMEEEGDVNTASFYKLHMGDHSFVRTMYGKEYTAADLSALFLKRVIEDAEKKLGLDITDAVITVPAYFENPAKDDTIMAGKKAGLNVLNIINEPTAACVAYGLNGDKGNQKILIYDLGGGTFDITIAEVTPSAINVLGTNGIHELGGRDWDKVIADWLAERFYEETGIDISTDEEMSAINMVSAENAKKQLSTAMFCDIKVDDGNQKCKFRLTRDAFEEMTSYQLKLTTDIIDETFADIKIGWNDISGAILVGGSTKMPMVRNYLTSHGVTILEGVNPDEAVSVGAAIQANISSYCGLTVEAKSKSSLAIAGSDMNMSLLPGATVINDVISHSLGWIVASEDETRFLNDVMIKKNTPFSEARTTKTRELRVGRKVENNKLDVYLLQGDDDNPLYCSIVKKYVYYDIPFVEGKVTRLDITFSHTYNGVIDISAVQRETGKVLPYREERIPEDMSWLEGSPKDLYGSVEQQPELSGALVLALDLSGSMSGRPLKLAKEAMKNFAEQFIEYVNIGIIGFSDRTKVVCHPTKNKKLVWRAIDALEVGQIGVTAPENKLCQTGYGNESNPTRDIFKCLSRFKNDMFLYGVVLTDGVWDRTACDDAIKNKNDFVKNEIELIGMGFGGADKAFLKKISTRDDLSTVVDVGELTESLSSIAKVISE